MAKKKAISKALWDKIPAQGEPGEDFPLGKVKVLGSWNKDETKDNAATIGFVVLPASTNRTTLINGGNLKAVVEEYPDMIKVSGDNITLNTDGYLFGRDDKQLMVESNS